MNVMDRRYEADETDADPANAMLDMAENNIRAVLACGLECQLRTRLARLVPNHAPPAPTPPAAQIGPPLTGLDWAAILVALRQAPVNPQTAAARALVHAQIKACKHD